MSRIPPGDELWQAIVVGYCEWENGDWPDDRDIEDARPAAQHVATYVQRWMKLRTSADREALRLIAYFEPQTDESAETMRQIARSAIRDEPPVEEPNESPEAWL